MEKIDQIVLDKKYNGPDGSGNGGYVSGRIASYFGAYDSVEVTLRMPPPLGSEIEVFRTEDGLISFVQKGKTIATARLGELEIVAPAPVDMATARECTTRYPGFERHPFPHCYVCGTEREACDGLRIYSGKDLSREIVAAPFDTFEGLYDADGNMNAAHIWAALDCPGSYAINEFSEPKIMVLGRITGQILRSVPRDMSLISMAWYLGGDGRKSYCGSCIYSGGGELIALSKATWIEVDPAVFYNRS